MTDATANTSLAEHAQAFAAGAHVVAAAFSMARQRWRLLTGLSSLATLMGKSVSWSTPTPRC